MYSGRIGRRESTGATAATDQRDDKTGTEEKAVLMWGKSSLQCYDWNPAEMIGIRPKPLALSLYR